MVSSRVLWLLNSRFKETSLAFSMYLLCPLLCDFGENNRFFLFEIGLPFFTLVDAFELSGISSRLNIAIENLESDWSVLKYDGLKVVSPLFGA